MYPISKYMYIIVYFINKMLLDVFSPNCCMCISYTHHTIWWVIISCYRKLYACMWVRLSQINGDTNNRNILCWMKNEILMNWVFFINQSKPLNYEYYFFNCIVHNFINQSICLILIREILDLDTVLAKFGYK